MWLTFLHKVTWRLRKEEQACTNNDSPQKLNSNGDSIRACVESVLSCIHDAVGKKDADGDAKLIAGDQSATDCLWRYLRHVQDDDS